MKPNLKPLFLILMLGIWIHSASADISINNSYFSQSHIIINKMQNATNFTTYSSTDVPSNTLQFYINNSRIRFSADTNKTINTIQVNNVTDIVSFKGTGTNGSLTFKAIMQSASTTYVLKVDEAISSTAKSDSNKEITFTIANSWNTIERTFQIEQITGIAVDIINDIDIDLDNGAYLTIKAPITFMSSTEPVMTIYNSTDTPSSTFETAIDTIPFRISTNTNKTINDIDYTNDIFTINVTGTDGYLYLRTKMANPLQSYVLKSAGTVISRKQADSNGYVEVTYNSGWSTKTLTIEPASGTGLPVLDDTWQTVAIYSDTTLSNLSTDLQSKLSTSSNIDWLNTWNATTQKYQSYRPGWTINANYSIKKGEAIRIKVLSDDELILDESTGTFYWNVTKGMNLLGLDYNGNRTIAQINTSINNGTCNVDKIIYVDLDQTRHTFICGNSQQATTVVGQWEGFFVNSTVNSSTVRSWS